ncbi:hypothetical protein PR048_032808 [Dryococelus australis]|uniref:DUF659 domain-containing protein n=1 Tax=Dryococelus australis TaxID=614101 RepID=A0ABQ9G385_9NEOP|nr:hypothetical protein PR048_032808 [Dryococelus australis]
MCLIYRQNDAREERCCYYEGQSTKTAGFDKSERTCMKCSKQTEATKLNFSREEWLVKFDSLLLLGKVITTLFEKGSKVVSVVCDQSSTNLKVFELLGITQ